MSIDAFRKTAVLTALLVTIASCAPASSESTDAGPVVLVSVPGGVAATSMQHGPFEVGAGRATGFTHDAVGAALAASHIGPRITSAAGPDIAVVTLREQCWGDVGDAIAHLAAAQPVSDRPPGDDLTTMALYFRVIGGDGRGDLVLLSLLADTPQARERGGYSRVDVSMRRHHGDWQLRVPVQRASLQPDVEGYTLLGPTS